MSLGEKPADDSLQGGSADALRGLPALRGRVAHRRQGICSGSRREIVHSLGTNVHLLFTRNGGFYIARAPFESACIGTLENGRVHGTWQDSP